MTNEVRDFLWDCVQGYYYLPGDDIGFRFHPEEWEFGFPGDGFGWTFNKYFDEKDAGHPAWDVIDEILNRLFNIGSGGTHTNQGKVTVLRCNHAQYWFIGCDDEVDAMALKLELE